ncbi:MAG: DUF362 domain-containing protein [Clostridiales bacterium]|nr:DUF362 domain-containing protein [Clostridiales bacterium]
MNNAVSLNYLDDYSQDLVDETVEKAFTSLNLNRLFKPKMKVLLKTCMPNSEVPDKAQCTHPSIIRGLVNVLTKRGVACVVADSPYGKASLINLDQAYLNTGMLEVANLTTCELNHDLSVCDVEVPNGVMTKKLTLLDIATQVDAIVNVGKIKIDKGYVGACANIFGLIPAELKTLVKNRMSTLGEYHHYIIDMLETIGDKLVLNVLDGIVALEANNTQRMLSCLAISEDAFSLDASIMDILGIKYKDTILKQAEDRGYFDSEKPYKLVDKKIEDFVIKDFALVEFDQDTRLSDNKKQSKQYFRSHQDRVKIDKKKCKGCGVCSKICPSGAIMMKYDKEGELYAEVDYKKCIFCDKCHTACPYSVVEKITPIGYKSLIKNVTRYNESEENPNNKE